MTSDINRNSTVWLGYKQVAKTRRSLTPTSLENIFPSLPNSDPPTWINI